MKTKPRPFAALLWALYLATGMTAASLTACQQVQQTKTPDHEKSQPQNQNQEIHAMENPQKHIITEPNAGSPIGPYSQAIRVGNLLFVSGQIGLNPATGELQGPGFADEARQMMTNLGAILKKAGTSYDNVIKSTIYVRDMGQFAQLNELYGGYFTAGNYPARETVEVSGLPKNARVEISVVALVP